MSIVPNENDSFGTSVTKNLVLSTVVTIGTLTGMIVVGYTWNKIETVKANRQAKKAAKTK